MKTLKRTLAVMTCFAAFCGFVAPFGNASIKPNTSLIANAAATVWDGTEDISWYDGEESEMHISTAEEFAGFIKILNSGTKMDDQTIILDKDIYLNEYTDQDTWAETFPENRLEGSGNFNGIFEGGGHTIYGLYLDSSMIQENNGTIKNLNIESPQRYYICYKNNGTMENITIKTARSLTMCCYNTSTILNCQVEAISDTSGLICYENSGTIDNCISSGKAEKGGITVTNSGEITNCTNKADVTGIYGYASYSVVYWYSGGICAYSSGDYSKINNCKNSGSINCNDAISFKVRDFDIGGIVGYSSNEISDCENSGDVSGGIHAGGIVGRTESRIENSKNTGKITGLKYVGGIAGKSSSVISSYNCGNIKSNEYAGGIIGEFYNVDSNSKLINCYSAADTINANNCGGLVGYVEYSANISDCYFLNTGAPQGIGNKSTTAGTAKSKNNMKKEEFAESLGSAFVYNPDGYPILFWEAGIPMLSIENKEISLTEFNQQETITVDTSYDGELIWTSDDEAIATVDKNGVITAIGNGTCKITVEAEGAKASCIVTVDYDYYLSDTDISLKVDLAKTLTVYSKATDNPIDFEIEFYSTNEDVAEVNKRGIISANAPGEAEIHAVIGDCDMVCTVTVETVRGDVNADGELTVADIVLMQKWLLNAPDAKLNFWKAGDLYQDNVIDVFDLVMMRKALLEKN